MQLWIAASSRIKAGTPRNDGEGYWSMIIVPG
jgi:hypothetical protein